MEIRKIKRRRPRSIDDGEVGLLNTATSNEDARSGSGILKIWIEMSRPQCQELY